MQMSMQMHRDGVGITMGQFLRFHYGLFFCNFYIGGIGFVIIEYCGFTYYLCDI